MTANIAQKRTRSDYHIYLIGSMEHQIVGSKLPSNRQVLSTYFYNIRVFGLSKNESARIVINEVFVFWDKARIDRSAEWYCIKKLEKLHEQWDKIRKSHAKNKKEQEDAFLNSFDDLFDIAARDALKTMKNEDSKQFLIAQRKKGREGCLLGVDRKGQEKEEKKMKRLEDEIKRKEIAEREKQIYEPGE